MNVRKMIVLGIGMLALLLSPLQRTAQAQWEGSNRGSGQHRISKKTHRYAHPKSRHKGGRGRIERVAKAMARWSSVAAIRDITVLPEAMPGSFTIVADTGTTVLVGAMDTTQDIAIILPQDIGSITVMPEESMRLMASSGIFIKMAGGITTSTRDGMANVRELSFRTCCFPGYTRMPFPGTMIARRQRPLSESTTILTDTLEMDSSIHPSAHGSPWKQVRPRGGIAISEIGAT